MRKPFYTGLAKQCDLIAKAADWRGTPFRAGARAMGVGVDCVQMVAAIYEATGCIQEFVPGPYSMDSGRHADRSKVIDYVNATNCFDLVWESGADDGPKPQSGDLLCFTIGKQVHHVGLALSPLKFLHVYRGYAAKEALFNDPTWRKRLARIYRPVTDEVMAEAIVPNIVRAMAEEKPQIVQRPKQSCIPCQQKASARL